jgi:hypothetical protein
MFHFLQRQINRIPWIVKVIFISLIGFIGFDVLLLAMANFSSTSKIDPGLATLWGAVIGLCVVAWQTRRGFQNLIKSQQNEAELQRIARLHQQELDAANITADERRKKQVLVAALWAETVSLHKQVGDAHMTAVLMREMAKGMQRKGAQNTSSTIIFRAFDAPIYKANIPNLGLLGASVAADVVLVASRATGTSPNVTQDHPPSWDVMATIYHGHAEMLEDWLRDLLHVANRLRSVMNGTPDPGPLLPDPGPLFSDRQRRLAD